MADLYAFLHPVAPENVTEDVVISDRFRNQDGTVAPFKIKALTKGEVERIARQCRAKHPGKDFDVEIEMGNRMILAATVEPDFSNKELCEAYGTLDPLEVVSKMLLYGEANKLAAAISKLSGADTVVDIKN